MKTTAITALLTSVALLAAPVMAQTPPAAEQSGQATGMAAPAADPAVTTSKDTSAAVPPAGAATAPTATLSAGTFTAPEGYTSVADFATLTADQIKSIDLHGPDQKNIGSISDVELGADGKITGLITDVGGFLGMGAHRVKLGLDHVGIFRNADGKLIAVTNQTEESLKAMPAYEAPAN